MILWFLLSLAAVLIGGFLAESALATDENYGPEIELAGAVIALCGVISLFVYIVVGVYEMIP